MGLQLVLRLSEPMSFGEVVSESLPSVQQGQGLNGGNPELHREHYMGK